MYKAAVSEHSSYSEENLRIISVEDVVEDVELIHEELKRAGLSATLERVDTESDFLRAIGERADVILCDFTLPNFDGMTALQIVKKTIPEVPFIFVSGTIGEELAIQTLRSGAYDYVLKSNIARLPSSVRRALQESYQRAMRRRSEEALHAERNLLSAVFDTAGAVGVMLDAEGRILRFNQAGENATGYISKDILELCFWDLFFTSSQAQIERGRYQQVEKDAVPIKYQSQWLTRDGRVRTLLCSLSVLKNNYFKTVFIVSGIDITEWQEAEEKIYHLSHFDHITGLPNRAVLRDCLEPAIHRQQSHGGIVALMLVELSGLSKIRDAFGSQAGVALIIAAARRLQSWKPPETMTIAQYADGVFAVLLEE
eukprot:gene26826-29476_t